MSEEQQYALAELVGFVGAVVIALVILVAASQGWLL